MLNEGKRFRQLEYGIFLTPDPLEYVDGYNPYIYCGQNPWGKWDPLGLEGEPSYWEEYKYAFKQQGASIVSLGLDFIPFVSTAKSAAELVSGNDVVTGEDIPRWVSAAGLIPFGKFASKGVKAAGQELVAESVEGAVKNAKSTAEKVNDGSKQIGNNATRTGSDALGDASKNHASEAVTPPSYMPGSAKVNTGTTVIGNYPNYVTKAQCENKRYFSIPGHIWDRMTPEQQWAANVKFLERTIKRGDKVEVAGKARNLRENSWARKEVKYLEERNVKVNDAE